MRQNVYTIGEVNRYISNMFAQDFMMQHICVSGEISNCKYHTSGHIYFTLKDATGVLAAVMFRGQRGNLNFQLQEGQNVIVNGRIGVYEASGKYQLYADAVQLSGAGDLYLRYEALKKELEEMGMFAPEYKKPIPKYAHRVGIVTAPTGAAIRDIQNISSRRNPYVQMILYPALVQGEGAAASIVQGIRALEQLEPQVDVIIVGRGGGSIEDLWAFNEEIVARAIFDCTIPIISAVGHETDTTIADYVADLRAPTPSAAAELAVYDREEFYAGMRTMKSQLHRCMTHHIGMKKQQCGYMQSQLRLLSPRNQLNNKRQLAIDLEEQLQRCMENCITDKKHRMEIYIQQLEGLSPAKKLMQGYSVVLNNAKKSITSIQDVAEGEKIEIQVADGIITAAVESKKEKLTWQKK